MNIRCLNEKIAEGLQKAVNIIPAKTGASFLRTVWLKAEEGKLKIMSTDSNLEFCGDYEVEVKTEGLAGVNGKSFNELIHKLPKGELSLKYDDATRILLVEQGRRKYKLPTGDPNWFQPINLFPEEGSAFFPGDFLQEIIDSVSFCIGDDETADALSCLSIRKSREPEFIDLCGLNGHQFAMKKITNEDVAKIVGDGIMIKKKYLLELRKWLSREEVEFNVSAKRMFFRNAQKTEIFSLPINAYKYPDYYSFISAVEGDGLAVMEFNKEEMVQALERILIFNTESQRCTAFQVNGRELMLTSQGQEIGDATETMEVNFEGKLGRILFPTKNIIEILSKFSSEGIKFTFTGPEGPCGISGKDDKDYMVIAMPMRVQEETYYTEEEA